MVVQVGGCSYKTSVSVDLLSRHGLRSFSSVRVQCTDCWLVNGDKNPHDTTDIKKIKRYFWVNVCDIPIWPNLGCWIRKWWIPCLKWVLTWKSHLEQHRKPSRRQLHTCNKKSGFAVPSTHIKSGYHASQAPFWRRYVVILLGTDQSYVIHTCTYTQRAPPCSHLSASHFLCCQSTASFLWSKCV